MIVRFSDALARDPDAVTTSNVVEYCPVTLGGREMPIQSDMVVFAATDTFFVNGVP